MCLLAAQQCSCAVHRLYPAGKMQTAMQQRRCLSAGASQRAACTVQRTQARSAARTFTVGATPMLPAQQAAPVARRLSQRVAVKAAARAITTGALGTQMAMNIVFVSAEVAPWSKTGGLGDVVGGLPIELAKRGHKVLTIAPR